MNLTKFGTKMVLNPQHNLVERLSHYVIYEIFNYLVQYTLKISSQN